MANVSWKIDEPFLAHAFTPKVHLGGIGSLV